MDPGTFVISLDLELHWGVFDHKTVEEYRANLLGVREAIPRMLDLFDKYSVCATFATVGFLFCDSIEDIERYSPSESMRPSYDDPRLDPYALLSSIGSNEGLDPFHYGLSLIEQIRARNVHEVSTHTFAHYYCREGGQRLEQFDADIESALAVAAARGFELKTIVFPRNQSRVEYLDVLRQHGIIAYRGQEQHWIYGEELDGRARILQRACRLMDAYTGWTGAHTYDYSSLRSAAPMDIPSSAFLRPYEPRLAALEPLKVRRLCRAMTDAGERGRLFHLWWHPHNFGANLRENLSSLEQLLEHYSRLNLSHGMRSLTMLGLCQELSSG
jgi:hypothetical protein